MISPLQRIATETVEIEPTTARDQDLLATRAPVVEPLEIVSPAAVLVDLVENPERAGRQLAGEDAAAIVRDIPIQIPRTRSGQAEGKGRLANLPGAGHEHHAALQVGAYLTEQISRAEVHGARVWVIWIAVKNTRE